MVGSPAKITILGSGEAFDARLGNCSCLLHGTRVPTVLFDCGYQVPERLWRLERIYPELEAIYLTHLHADHCFGIVPLLTRFWEEKRQAPLLIIGPKGVERHILQLMEAGYPRMFGRLPFPVEFVEASPKRELRVGPLEFRFAQSLHSITNLSVRVDLKIAKRATSFGISGDGKLSPQSAGLFSDVDLLLHELYWLKPIAPTHCDWGTLKEFVDASPIRRIGVTHLSREDRTKIEREVLRAARKDSRWFVAEPGMELEL